MPRAAPRRAILRLADDSSPFVITDLFAVAAGLSCDAVGEAIPPACRRVVENAPPARRDGDDTLVEVGPWQPRRGARHLLPAFSVLSRADYSVRFELSALVAGEWSPWVGLAPIGPARFPEPITPVAGLDVDVDVVRAPAPVEGVKLRLRLRAADATALLAAPWLLTLSTCDLGPLDTEPAPGAARLAVPPLSQMVEGGALAARVCSPTSVAMVMAYLGAEGDVGRLAAEMFHPALDLYGVWPAAICAAARRGALGYLLRFPDWAAAAWCLERGLPVIASVRYAAGELAGAAIGETAGHLLVLTGYDSLDVLVNDPAAPTTASVPRRYPWTDITRVWLERTGVGYVLFTPPAR